MFPPAFGRRKFPGFTIIEVLVVVAIAAVLGALLLPQYSKIKGSATKGQCASHLRQLGAVVHLYLADNNMKLPNSINGWAGNAIQWEGIASYADWQPKTPSEMVAYNSILHFPNHYDEPDMRGSFSYRGNQFLFPTGTTPVNYPSIVSPSRKVMFFEVHTKALVLIASLPSATGKRPWIPALTYHSHGNSDNFLFCDGHVESTSNQRADDWRFWEVEKTPPDFPF